MISNNINGIAGDRTPRFCATLRHYVTNNLLIPFTKPWQLSYADVAGPSRTQWFVTWAARSRWAWWPIQTGGKSQTSSASPGEDSSDF